MAMSWVTFQALIGLFQFAFLQTQVALDSIGVVVLPDGYTVTLLDFLVVGPCIALEITAFIYAVTIEDPKHV